MSKRVVGVIGGSGVYAIDLLERAERRVIETPWGAPSGPLTTGSLNGVDVIFLPRHGEGHVIPPGEVNYRANIDAMKRVGATDIISVSACGSFREELGPGTFIIVDQFIDRTSGRAKSFFGRGCVAHVSMAKPVCPALCDALEASMRALSIPHQRGGTYLCIDGPQFSSLAESRLYRSWGADVIGMTNMPEAKLAREAELPYATVAMVTDYDCWREESGHVEVAGILEIMRRNSEAARRLVGDVVGRLGPVRTMSPLRVERTLDFAIITPPEARDPALVAMLDAVAGRTLSGRRASRD
ncbi:MAG: S-methyl-5'-thioadenosine phosphorylase [Parvularculaceae bacterium]|nr:S-methyl-5'-thioadenosine phosphorylase [Parvularculaceae bacterium]